jgi:hypothetical protein
VRQVFIPNEKIEKLEAEIGGKLILEERLNQALERVLKRKRARRPNFVIKTMRHPLFPAEEFVPVEIKIDPFSLGRQFDSGYHLFFRRKRVFTGVDIA